ncbi:TetR/AcrR family transcriptional regulator [Nakamurella sp. GG22]
MTEGGSGTTPPPAATPRDRLILATVELAGKGGVSHLSLRRLADELGTSHRMLIYHFGSKDGLIAEVVSVVEGQQRAALARLLADDDAPPLQQVDRFWNEIIDNATVFGPLFFELTGQALQGRPHTVRLLDGMVDSWIEPLAKLYERIGISPARAPAHARLGLAAARGLLLDLLVTGDRAGVDAANDLLRELILRDIGGLPDGHDQPGSETLAWSSSNTSTR